MSWYSYNSFKNAAREDTSFASFLLRIGVPQETINYVSTINDERLRQSMIGILRKNPKATIEELNGQSGNNLQDNTNTPEEISLADRYGMCPEFQQWLLFQLKKARNNAKWNFQKSKIPYDGKSYLDPETPLYVSLHDYNEDSQLIYDWYFRGILAARAEMQLGGNEEPNFVADVINRFGIQNINTNIASLSFRQALDLSSEWHDVMAGRGNGVAYSQETSKDIVYGPQWKDPIYNGWTIKQVVTENNLKAEGNKMGHCVGSYCGQVQRGLTRIFSLRDPSNTPHVTMEVSPNMWEFQQINGNGPKTGNAEPNKQLKVMLGEWFSTLKGVTIAGYEDFDYEEVNYCDYREIDETLSNVIFGQIEGYGIEKDISRWDFEEAYDAVNKRLEKASGGQDNSGGIMTKYVAKVLANAIIKFDDKEINSPDFNYANSKKHAYNLALRERKNPQYKDIKDIRDPARLNALLAPYMKKAKDLVRTEFNYLKIDSPEFLSKANTRAFELMQHDKKFSEKEIKSFENLSSQDQEKYLAMAIDSRFACSTFNKRRQKNDDEFFRNYDDSYLEMPEAPDRDNYNNKIEYQNALNEWEEEKNRIRDEETEAVKDQNLPYRLDNLIYFEIEQMLSNKQIKIPNWVIKFFSRKNTSYNPYIMDLYQKQASLKRKTAQSLINKGLSFNITISGPHDGAKLVTDHPEKAIAFYAEHDGKYYGWILLSNEEEFVVVEDVVVDPEKRRLGIGTSLYNAAANYAHSLGKFLMGGNEYASTQAKGLWNKAVEQGTAEPFTVNNKPHFKSKINWFKGLKEKQL